MKRAKRVGDARWRQAGHIVYFEINDSYAQYKGTLSENGKSIHGSAQNINGKGWEWRAERVKG